MKLRLLIVLLACCTAASATSSARAFGACCIDDLCIDFMVPNWGTECGDVNGDDTTDVRDLVTTLGNWGTCDA